MASGTVRWFNGDKGFGFITSDETGEDLFVHYSEIAGDANYRTLDEGQRVEFTQGTGDRGPQATAVRALPGGSPREPQPHHPPRPENEAGDADIVTGVVAWFDADKGFGFLTPDDGGDDVFCHFSAINDADGDYRTLDEGQPVEFERMPGARGPQAHDVRLLAAAPDAAPVIVVRGTVRTFDADKGFGFITPEDVFVHFSAISGATGYRTLNPGDRVEFVLSNGERGLLAEDVRALAPDRPAERAPQRSNRPARGPARASSELEVTGEPEQGTVQWYNADKGFGFISPDDGSGDLFVHYSSLKGDAAAGVDEGARVTFARATGDKGAQAAEVMLVPQ